MSRGTAKSTPPPARPVAAKAVTAPRRTQRERSSQAERALLDAAATLFSQRGVDQTSLADVGELAGYSRGLANHHFGTKAALIEELARRTQAEFITDYSYSDGDMLGALLEVADNYLATIGRGTEATRAFFVMWGAAIPSEATLRPVFATDDARFRLGVAAVLHAGQKNKSVAADLSADLGAVMFVGMLRGIATQYLIDPDAFDITAARKACQQFVQRSFAPTPKRARSNS